MRSTGSRLNIGWQHFLNFLKSPGMELNAQDHKFGYNNWTTKPIMLPALETGWIHAKSALSIVHSVDRFGTCIYLTWAEFHKHLDLVHVTPQLGWQITKSELGNQGMGHAQTIKERDHLMLYDRWVDTRSSLIQTSVVLKTYSSKSHVLA